MSNFISDIECISLGTDCSPAVIIRDLGLRKNAYPFDWVDLHNNHNIIIRCIENNFETFHNNVYLSKNKTRIIDENNIQFPHDYPTKELKETYDINGENNNIEEKIIINNWKDYELGVKNKYKRRCNRFMNILNGNQKIIFFHRGNLDGCIELYNYIKNKYPNLVFALIVATNENKNYEYPYIFICNPERNGDWNNKNIWYETYLEAKKYLEK
jgi:hypothetical protein